MRKLFVLVAALVAVNCAQAQFLSWGLKAGGNSVVNTKLSDFKDINGKDILVKQADKPWGMHFGAFLRVKVLAIYIQPELLFSQSKTEIDVREMTGVTEGMKAVVDQKFNKFDVPVMIGAKFGPARINLGPVATFVLSEGGNFRDKVNDIAEATVTEEFKGATFGFQVGAGLDILKTVSLDVRYEFGLSKFGDSFTVAGKKFNTDQRNNQLVLSLGVYL